MNFKISDTNAFNNFKNVLVYDHVNIYITGL